MNIYLVHQSVNSGYDTFDGFIVVAENEEVARYTSPSNYYVWKDNQWKFCYSNGSCTPSSHNAWCLPNEVQVTLIGKADEKYNETTVILNSFNAG